MIAKLNDAAQKIHNEFGRTTRDAVRTAEKHSRDAVVKARDAMDKAVDKAVDKVADKVTEKVVDQANQQQPPPSEPRLERIEPDYSNMDRKERKKMRKVYEKNIRAEKKNLRKEIDQRIKAERVKLKRQRAPVGSTLSESLDNLLSLLRFNITFKMTMNNLLVMLLLVSFFAYVLVASLTLVRYVEIDSDYGKMVTRLSKTVDSMDEIRSDEFRNLSKVAGLDYVLTDAQGNDLYATRMINPEEATTYNVQNFIKLTTPANIKWEFEVTLDSKPYTLTFYKAYLLHDVYYAAFYQILLGFGVIFIIVYVVWINGVTKRTLWPIKSMTYTVEEISIQSLNKRIDTTSTKDELKDLAVTFNRMMDNIQESYEKQKQFVSDASHELRTPIAIIQGYVGMLERWGKNDPEILNESIEAIRDESLNMQSLVEKMLFIARSEKGKIEYEMETVDLDATLTDMASDFRMIDSGHHFVTELSFEDNLTGNRDALVQLFRIFVDNSIKYTPEGGTISLRSKRTDGYCVVEIEDTGMGIDQEDLPKIFDRFFRADKSRTKQDEKAKSFGLGLSIARIILDGHNAKVIPESESGVGTKMSIFFKL